MSTRRIRVLVADDSLTVRKYLVDLLSTSEGFEVVSEAVDGEDAIRQCIQHRPDVMTLDLMMPGATGIEVTQEVMARAPTPIVIVSSSQNRGALLKTYDALASGAVDVFEKPDFQKPVSQWNEGFLATLRMASRIKVITHLSGRASTAVAPAAPKAALDYKQRTVLAIGASTGGPGALKRVLQDLRLPLPAAVLVLLHVDAPFDVAFAEWLSRELNQPVRCARDGESLQQSIGSVLLAPAGRHLIVGKERLWLSDGPAQNSCKPSVDALFTSLAESFGPNAAGCLLTGMGTDGAKGLLALRAAGASTIAQDEASSVIFGMPKAAIDCGAAQQVLPLEKIGAALRGMLEEL